MAANGRPTLYGPDLAAEICGKIADGKSLRTICREDHMPAMSSVFLWLGKYPEFSEQYARAKDAQADAFIEDMQDIADTPPALTAEGKIDAGDVADKRLRIDTRKWIASKLKPKKYGDKVEQTVQGPDGGAVQHDLTLNVSFVKSSAE